MEEEVKGIGTLCSLPVSCGVPLLEPPSRFKSSVLARTPIAVRLIARSWILFRMRSSHGRYLCVDCDLDNYSGAKV